MAGRAELVHLYLERIEVAVSGYAHDLLAVAAGLALAPELFAAAAPEAGVALAERYLKALAVHPGDHEQLAALRVNDDGGNKPLCVEFQLIKHICVHLTTSHLYCFWRVRA